MKKLASLTISGLLLVSTLTACGSQSALDPSALSQQPILAAQSVANQTLSFNKQPAKIAKVSTSKVKDKITPKIAKNASTLVVKFSTTQRNDIGTDQIASIANYTLASMNQAGTWDQGYKIGMDALASMSSNGVYVAKVSWAAGNATKNWDDGFKVVAAALNFIAAGNPNTPAATCDLVVNMMAANGTWEDGYKAGYAAMQVVGNTDNQNVRMITDLALRQADGTTDWSLGFNVIKNAFIQLRNSF